jgi:hypothetical protein
MKGENPLAANASANEIAEQAMANAGNDQMMEDRRPRGNGQVGGVGAGPRANQAIRGFGSVPQLNGVAQIVGLALGSPEFQRR